MVEFPAPQPTSSGTSDAIAAAQNELLERLRVATRGEYDIFGELGRGGMATVFLAHEISLDRKVAIKVMSPNLLQGPEIVERFKREARTAANLSHPNIIPIYAVREADGLLFCVIKLVRGTPLDAIIRELGKLPIAMVQAILAQVGDALEYAHRHGVVHRDIKPGNILIDDDGWAVVTDFGIAKVPEEEGLTLTGVTVGTPTYMSPEQCNQGPITGASDQYSLGVVAYEMLTGRPPFLGTSMMALMYSHYHDTPPSIDDLRPGCPPAVRDAVMRMLAKDPLDRWPSLADASAALGARPLTRDDPTRSQLISLARTGASHRIVSQVQTPRSPIPLPRRSGEGPPLSTTAAPWARPLFGVVAFLLVAVGYLLARLASAPAPAASVAPPAPGAAPVVPSITPPATRPLDSATVRRSIPTLVDRKSTPTPAAVDSSRLATSAATPPRARILSSAPAGSTTTAPVVSVPQLRAPATNSPPPAASSPPPVSATPPVDATNEVRSVIQAFARALAGADMAAARSLYPTMPDEQREGFEALWKSGGTMTPRWTVSDIVIDGTVATARIRGSNAVTGQRGAPGDVPVALRARLERRGAEWRIVALVN